MNDKKIELIKKVKALAEKGVDGESDNAKEYLELLMKKYNINELDIIEDKKYTEWFRYSQEMEKRLLNQIIYMVTGDVAYGCKAQRKIKKLGVDCTKSEKIEIELNFDFYKKAIQKELDVFFTAFANQNNLFPRKDKKDNSKSRRELSEEELRNIQRATSMMQGMDVYTMKKQIGTG